MTANSVASTYKMMFIIWVWLEAISATRVRHSQATLSEERQTVECGEVIKNQSKGLIQSPNYPVAYPPNCNCKWSIYTGKGKLIQLKIIDIDLEVNQKQRSFCSFDYITVRGLPGQKSKRFCGRAEEGTILLSSSNKIEISFRSDKSNQRPGFRIVYQVEDPKAGKYGRPAIPESTTTTQALTKAVTTTTQRRKPTTTTVPIETTTTLQLTTQAVTKAKTLPPRRRTPRPTRTYTTTTTTLAPPLQQQTSRPGEIVAESDKLFIDGKNNKQVDTWLIIVVVVVGSSIIFFLLTSLCLFIADHK